MPNVWKCAFKGFVDGYVSVVTGKTRFDGTWYEGGSSGRQYNIGKATYYRPNAGPIVLLLDSS